MPRSDSGKPVREAVALLVAAGLLATGLQLAMGPEGASPSGYGALGRGITAELGIVLALPLALIGDALAWPYGRTRSKVIERAFQVCWFGVTLGTVAAAWAASTWDSVKDDDFALVMDAFVALSVLWMIAAPIRRSRRLAREAASARG